VIRCFFIFLKGAAERCDMKNEYDLDSAITFLMVGLGIGSVLALIFNPKEDSDWKAARRSRIGAVEGCQEKSVLSGA
jgi:hypothetical protein